MKIIGVTGGVGAGKSAILSYLKEKYQAEVILADQVANDLKEPGATCYTPIVELLGLSVLQSDGKIDRKTMGQMIFSDKELLRQVNRIIHPAVKKYIIEQIEKKRYQGAKVFVIEAALLLEDNYDEICDELWYIYTAEEVRRQRLKDNRGYSEEYTESIMKKQLSDEIFRSRCDFVIDNSGELGFTKEQIDKRMQEDEIM